MDEILLSDELTVTVDRESNAGNVIPRESNSCHILDVEEDHVFTPGEVWLVKVVDVSSPYELEPISHVRTIEDYTPRFDEKDPEDLDSGDYTFQESQETRTEKSGRPDQKHAGSKNSLLSRGKF